MLSDPTGLLLGTPIVNKCTLQVGLGQIQAPDEHRGGERDRRQVPDEAAKLDDPFRGRLALRCPGTASDSLTWTEEEAFPLPQPRGRDAPPRS